MYEEEKRTEKTLPHIMGELHVIFEIKFFNYFTALAMEVLSKEIIEGLIHEE